MNITDTIEPKVDQLTADHLIGRTLTIRITEVRLTSSEQPCEIAYDGDDGLPYRPGKSMRRVLVHVWGGDVKQYVGRSMRLYRDDDVQFGGLKVGGVRISHMSHIDGPVTMALTAKKGSKKAYKVLPLPVEQSAEPKPTGLPIIAPDGSTRRISPGRYLDKLREALDRMTTPAALTAWCLSMAPCLAEVRAHDDALAHQAEQLAEGRAVQLAGPPQDEPGATEPKEGAG